MITQFNADQHAKNLPDAYRKDGESNNAKILDIEKGSVDALRGAVAALYDALDLDKATGSTLDLYGEMLGQKRGKATDEQLRVLIKNRIMRGFVNGDHTSIIHAICATFDCDPADVLLTELEEPCKVMLEGLPFSKLNESNIDVKTAVRIVNGLIPVGVYMQAIEFSGTFEFSGTELVYDEEAGFGNEEQTIGGYLGFVSDSNESNLPV